MYISENAPRAIRGGLTGIYQLFIATGTMLAFWINYGSLLHITGPAVYIVPLAMQALPAIALLGSMWFCKESPRWLARQDRWDEASAVLSAVRALPSTHPYVQMELREVRDQLEHERALIGGASFRDLMKEMWTIPGNRKRAILTICLMVTQQMTGTVSFKHPFLWHSTANDPRTPSTTTHPRSSRTLASGQLQPAYLRLESTVL